MRNPRWTVTMTALALVAALAACDDDSGKSAADPNPSEAATSTSYTLLRNAGSGDLDAGTYGLVPAGAAPVKNVAVVQAPAGYRQFDGWTFVTPDGAGPFRALGIMTVAKVFEDPCGSVRLPKTVSLKNPGPGVEDLATALTEQTGATTSTPAPVTLDGHSGLYLDYQIAKDVDIEDCEGKTFDMLTMAPHDDSGWWFGASHERAGIWILDVDGDRVLLSWVAEPGVTEAQIQELKDMAASTTFEPLVS